MVNEKWTQKPSLSLRNRAIDPRHDLDLEVVSDVEAVVHDGGSPHGGAGAVLCGHIGRVTVDAFEGGPVPGAVHEADAVTSRGEFTGECGAGGPGAEDCVQVGCGGHDEPLHRYGFLQLLETITPLEPSHKRLVRLHNECDLI